VSARNPHAIPYIHENYMRTWRKMEELVDRGLVRHIGTSNMTIPKMELVLRDARIKPVANEMELHPHFQQTEFFEYLQGKGIQPIGYSPIGSPGRPERDRTPEDTSPTEDPVIVEIAQRIGVHPAVVCIKWAVQRGQVPIPFSANPRNILGNLLGVVGEPLSADDMSAIEKVDRNCRLIKGQVFLWRDNQSWEDLWDVNGVITPA
jgi:diketogulonate reductase-like aldo/keto reductase